MAGEKQRKTDRRTIYTKSIIKDSVLILMEQMQFDRLSISAVCKEADITRSTFYMHYDNLTQVLDELIADALQLAEQDASSPIANMYQFLELLRKNPDPDFLKQHKLLLPPCQRIADHPKYHILFNDSSISEYILDKLYQTEKDIMVPSLMEYTGLSRFNAQLVFRLLLHGSFAVNKTLKWKKEAEWYAFQEIALTFLTGGNNALRDTYKK